MTKYDFCNSVQTILEALRKEVAMTLEEMAMTIGLSKKTLIQIEKKRTPLKWAEAVTTVIIFEDNELIKALFGDEVIDIIQSISIQKPTRRQLKTLGGESWWKMILAKDGFRLQQHKISRHFRILDPKDYRVYFTYHKHDATTEFNRYFGDSDG